MNRGLKLGPFGMSDSEIPDRFGVAIRYVIWGALTFIFLLVAVEQFFNGDFRKGALSAILALACIAGAVYWPMVARRFGLGQTVVPSAAERARIAGQLSMVKRAGTEMLDPVTIAGIWAGTLDPHHTKRHLLFRAIKEAIAQGKLPGTVLKDGVNKDARVPVAALESFWREAGVIDDVQLQQPATTNAARRHD